MWGTIRPTKAIGPAMATAPPDSSTNEARSTARVRATRWPSACATSSPSASAFSARPANSAPARPMAMNGPATASVSRSRPATEPTTQNRNSFSVCVSATSTAEVSAPNSAATAAPASARLIGAARLPGPVAPRP